MGKQRIPAAAVSALSAQGNGGNTRVCKDRNRAQQEAHSGMAQERSGGQRAESRPKGQN